jgi:putative membrane-bound dehydrogenase-like protein
MKRHLSLLALGLSLACTGNVAAQLPPDKELKSFKVSDGLDISLWASEINPLDPAAKEAFMVNPTCMDVDHKGRVWICESINYRQKLRNQKVMRRPEGDRILLLEDTKGTGHADKVTVFYQSPEIHAPLGIAVVPHTNGIGCTVYVCQSPDIWVFEDKNGDGKADGPPRKLLTGFKGIDHDHGVHGILIGPDNRLYFTVGDQGVKDLQSSDGKGPKFTSNNTDCQAGTVWRCDLDGKNLELIAHNFRNNYEPCVDSFGTIFLSDNDDDGQQQTRICYVMPGGNYGYHRSPKTSHWNEEHPGIVPKILRTYFGSPTGICVYEGNLFPEPYQGQLFHVDAGPRQARCYHLTPEGASYKVNQENMVDSSDNWFRPSDICIAPDGSAYIADWYDPGVGGHGMGDTTRGRIFRLAPSGNKPSVPKLDLNSKEGLSAALASPNLATRAVAMAKIRELGLPKALEVLEPLALQKNGGTTLRARALWQLGYLGNLRHVSQAFSDPDPNIRILAMRIFNDAKGQTPVDYIPDWQAQIVKDPSDAVRREALLLLRNADPVKAAPLIFDLAKRYDGQDRFYLCAVGIAVGQTDQKRRNAILAGFDMAFPQLDEKVARLLWELRPPGIVPMLDKRLADGKLPEVQRGLMVDMLTISEDKGAGQILLRTLATEPSADVRAKILAALKTNLAGKWSYLAEGKDWNQTITKLLDNPKTQLAGLGLAELGNKEDLEAKLAIEAKVLSLAQDVKKEQDIRLAALHALGAFPTPEAIRGVHDLYGKEPLPNLRLEILKTLGRQKMPNSEKILRDIAQAKDRPLEERQVALAGVSNTYSGSEWLLETYKKKGLADDLASDLARLLRNSQYQSVRKLATDLLPPPPKLDPKKLPSIQALLARQGNAASGKSIMEKTLKNDAACLKCHTINKVGGAVGPELSVIGSKASRENLLESILFPSRAVADQYIQWMVETKSGQAVSGILVEETPDYLLLRDVNAKDYKINRKDVDAKKKSPNSLMPDNLLLYLTEEELLDVVEYLYNLKSPPVTPTTWRREERHEYLNI